LLYTLFYVKIIIMLHSHNFAPDEAAIEKIYKFAPIPDTTVFGALPSGFMSKTGLVDASGVEFMPHFPTAYEHEEPPFKSMRIPTREDRYDHSAAINDSEPRFPVPMELDTGGNLNRMHAALWEKGEKIRIEEHLVLEASRTKPPKNISDFKFVPVLHEDPSYLAHNLSSISTGLITSDGVAFEYERPDIPGTMPFMDGRIGLGLSYRNRLVALCSGGLSVEGPIVLQIQDVSSKIPPDSSDPKILKKFYYSNGLRSGIEWKQTLVRGWCNMVDSIAPDYLPELVGKRTLVQSAQNNHWVNRQQFGSNGSLQGYKIDAERLPKFMKTYDGTARKLGAIVANKDGNFILPDNL
jgi:hypothetical protein